MATVNLSAQGLHPIADRDGSLTLYSWRIRTSQRRQRAIGRRWDQGTEYGICCSGENVHTVILTAGAPPSHTHLPLCCWDEGKVDLVKSSIGIYWENQTVESKCKILNRSWNHWGQRVSLFCKLQHSAKKKNHLSDCLERDIGKGLDNSGCWLFCPWLKGPGGFMSVYSGLRHQNVLFKSMQFIVYYLYLDGIA